jgi:hypothetical protein
MPKNNKRSKKLDPDSIAYLCNKCAGKLGWTWPKGHQATANIGRCEVCNANVVLTCEDDWLKKGEKSLRSWD